MDQPIHCDAVVTGAFGDILFGGVIEFAFLVA